jgi:tRNA 2-thiouridine synthesizing protein C
MIDPVIRRLMFVVNQSPQASPAARERLDQVLMALAFDQEVRLAFIADGVWQLLSGQASGDGGGAAFTSGYKSLSLYGLRTVLVEREALAERGIEPADLLLPVEVVSRAEIITMMHSQDLLL